MVIKVLIPVRSGSQRVKNKNIKTFAGSNLLSLKIEQMKRIKGIDGIIVNSNSDEMLDIARKHNVETIKREEYFASNTVSMNEVYQNMAQNCNCDDIIFADVTNPLIEDKTIEFVINEYFNNKNFDSITTVHLIREFMWQNNQPINYDKNNKPKSQDLPHIVGLNHAISILPRELMIEQRDIIGKNPNLFLINEIEAIDIDDETDFEIAEYLYNKLRRKKCQI